MPGKGCPKSKRKHTPIVSKAQRGAMGAALAHKRTGKPVRAVAKRIAASMSEAELSRYLKESAGRRLAIRKIQKK